MHLSKMAFFAFAAVYIVWGSTFVAIRYAIETIPPWALGTTRFFIAGAVLWLVSVLKREPALSRQELKITAISGPCLVIANAMVCVVEKWVPSGIVSVIVAAMPIWIMLLGWSFFGEARPTLRKVLGAAIGLVGIGLIAGGDFTPVGEGSVEFGVFLVLASSILWAAGTLIQRRAPKLKNPLKFSATQMLLGALSTAAFSLALEKPWAIEWASISTNSLLALLYLITFGSLIGFSAYSWLSRNVEPSLVSTYALVNPVIAVALGAFLLDEPVSSRFAAATVLVVIGLGLLMFRKRAPAAATQVTVQATESAPSPAEADQKSLSSGPSAR